MKKAIAAITTTSLSVFGLLTIYEVASLGCTSITYKSYRGLACGFEGYAQGLAWVGVGLVVGYLIWNWKNPY